MNQKERVEILRQQYPGYDRPLDSKAHKPQTYGITLTTAARELLRGEKKKNAPVYKLTIRLDRGKERELRAALKGREPADWVRERIDQKIFRSTHPTGGRTRAENPKSIVTEKGATVNGERP